MGNESTKGPKLEGGAWITTDRASYAGGEYVTGNVYLNLEKPTPPAQIIFGFKGKEKTKWIETQGSGKNRGRRFYYGKHHISNFKFPIYGWNALVQPGGYTIPYCFRLPDNLPGSFRIGSGRYMGRITYELRVKVLADDNRKIKTRAAIQIKQTATLLNQNVIKEKTAQISTWCCRKKGSVSIRANFAKDFYVPEESPNVIVDIDNSKSKLRLSKVHAKLIRNVRLTGKRFGLNLFNEVSTNFSSTSILTTCAEGVPEGIHNDGTSESNPLLKSKQIMFSLDLSSARDSIIGHFTTKGTLVECVYILEVSAEMDGNCMCCGDTPYVSSKMILYPNEVSVQLVPVAPLNWNPQIVDQININYDTQFERQPTLSAPKEPPPEEE